MNFTHLDQNGDVQQVPVGHKAIVERKACAYGFIHLSKNTLGKIKKNEIGKGNVLAVARIAGIQAAKKTADLIPLCHPLLLDHVEVDFSVDDLGIGVVCHVSTCAKTGVEMEALTAVQISLLTIYDMCKAIDTKMSFENIHLIKKTKGESK
ncbi:MAG: cyclic pyranopterin monophosphate synthase MoaC [Deltaproteobacteria bacterium]|nr:cyclic pyranopterin monophosphate synthase MoaC [Deltaproteobacteria bacterium]